MRGNGAHGRSLPMPREKACFQWVDGAPPWTPTPLGQPAESPQQGPTTAPGLGRLAQPGTWSYANGTIVTGAKAP